MANYTRSTGANARAPEWDDFEEEAQSQRRPEPRWNFHSLLQSAFPEHHFRLEPLRLAQPLAVQQRLERAHAGQEPAEEANRGNVGCRCGVLGHGFFAMVQPKAQLGRSVISVGLDPAADQVKCQQ